MVVSNFAGRIENIFEGIQEPRWHRASNSLCMPLYVYTKILYSVLLSICRLVLYWFFYLGYPPSDFTWTRDSSGGMVVHEGSKWFIYHVQLQDAGDYACIASNRIGSGTPGVRQLEVNGRRNLSFQHLLPLSYSLKGGGLVAECVRCLWCGRSLVRLHL